MLEIKTVTAHNIPTFDKDVNMLLAEGWELVKRECFITGSDRATTFYAELERIVDDLEEDDFDLPAVWVTTRDPKHPLRCSNCGYVETSPKPVCPKCMKVMEDC